MTKTFPKLFKKTSTGAIQTWEVSVAGNVITAIFGQLGGKMQTGVDVVPSGKNAGKKNETTADQQALLEAQATWEGKMKKGYVNNLTGARSSAVDEAFVEGGVNPMLAQTPEKVKTAHKFPVAVQPKLDGHRCVAVVKDGICTLWTRTRKPIGSVPHIIKAVEAIASANQTPDITLDGELYNHSYAAKFEELTSFIRSQEPKDGHEVVQYHVYDIVDITSIFKDRSARLASLGGISSSIVIVPTMIANTSDEVAERFCQFTADGYEGAMQRDMTSRYEMKRSMGLVKIKDFQDSEFTVLGTEEGRGNLAGHVGSFIFKTKDGKTFNAKMVGEREKLAEMWAVRDTLIGKVMTVKYQGLTGDGIPRFPVGMRFRTDI